MNQRTNKYLQMAYAYVSTNWLPVSPDALNHLRKGLASGAYENDREQLVNDTKKDLGLFTLCVRKLLHLAAVDGEDKNLTNPVALIRNAPLKDLKSVIADAERVPHAYSAAKSFQLEQCGRAILSASTAEALADSYDLDPDVAFSCGVFRQLGITLIAWNYPHIFERMFTLLEPGETIDFALHKMLGYSPSMLGFTIARQWELIPEIRIGMGDKSLAADNSLESETIARSGHTLEKLCKIGEALAYVNNPDQYPSARADWDTAKTDIVKVAGPEGFALIQDKLQDYCSNYISAFPDLLQDTGRILNDARSEGSRSSVLLVNNLYMKYCPPAVKHMLRDLYKRIDGRSVSRDAVDVLVKDIIPTTGFEGGCVYLLEPEQGLLVPRVAIGETSLSDYQAVNPRDEKAFVARAYRASGTTREEFENGSVAISGVMGDIQRAGVLVLNYRPNVMPEQGSCSAYFKALRQALCDCLGLH